MKHSILVLHITITILLIQINCQSSTGCDDCPSDCEFGVKRVKNSDGTCRCVCAEDPCQTRVCPERTRCKIRPFKNCRDGNCVSNLQPVCVSILKAGFCPSPDIIDESTSSTCNDDSDCDGTFKCCPSLTRNSCSKSCPITRCKCLGDTVAREVFNRQGCPVCTCVRESNETRNDICSLPRQYGECQSDSVRYYFDSQDKRCKPFTYSGCGGNGNNFLTLEFCQRKCLPEMFGSSNRRDLVKCFKPNDIGNCRGAFKRFFYNHKAQECQDFFYGGCDGNDNNFMSADECNQACALPISVLSKNPVLKCTQPMEVGNCRGVLARFHYNQTSQKCEEFSYSGCKGNGNNFETIDECENICNQEALNRLYLFRKNHHRQHQNRNRSNPEPAKVGKCSLKKDPGSCKGAFPRYFFNASSQKCEQFTYGGCEGNANNFESSVECAKECVPEKIPKCLQEKLTGPCRGYFKRFFYNKTSQKCEQFIYGGCAMNENNFGSQAECQAECGSKQDEQLPPQNFVREVPNKCSFAPETGLCRGYFPRFFFNKTSERCEEFVYGGCGGNENNFETVNECVTQCGGGPATVERETNDTDNVCSQPSEVGNCKGNFERFFYNKSTKKCEIFIYGGCGGNANNFETSEDCAKKCGAPSNERESSNVCELEKVVGLCRGYFPRYYFNKTTQKCEEFVYGGCGGNENNFETSDDCVKKCGGSTVVREIPEKCRLDAEPGLCLAYIPRYFYNRTTQKCEQFIYGGCGGNENSFETADDCIKECNGSITIERETDEKIDVCSLPSEVGDCKGNFDKYFFNSNTGRCEIFVYGGCGGNGNNFETETDCVNKCGSKPPSNVEIQTDKCKLAPEVGLCRGYFPKFFFNSTSNKCEEFIYGGCGGNANNFETVDDCAKECGGPTQPTTNERESNNVCELEKVVGVCRGYFPRYFFNKTTQTCEEFVYGGCGGNENNFETSDDCVKKCGGNTVTKQVPEKCALNAEPGPCFAYFQKYFFNTTSQKCELFIYGGCDGNENNFENVEDCAKECGGPIETPPELDIKCQLDTEVGPCRGYFPRFFFNRTTQQCERFVYGGCGGNGNNFETSDECVQRCGLGSQQGRKTPEKCQLEAIRGSCEAYMPRYFYNATSQSCEHFIYGGCGGNENRFVTSEECLKECGPVIEAKTFDKTGCLLAPEIGECQNSFQKYYFNPTLKACETFIYSGCGGNSNNFETSAECMRSCATPREPRSRLSHLFTGDQA